jgi:hypothetical protein
MYNSNKLIGGKGDKLSPEDVDPNELQMGIKVEQEHAKGNIQVATEIALDHLAEDPHYYSKLKAAGLADELKEEILKDLKILSEGKKKKEELNLLGIKWN